MAEITFYNKLDCVNINIYCRDWDKFVPYVLFAYREVPQTTTGFSPFELLFGREVREPSDVLERVGSQREERNITHSGDTREDGSDARGCERNVEEAQKRQKKWYDIGQRETHDSSRTAKSGVATNIYQQASSTVEGTEVFGRLEM